MQSHSTVCDVLSSFGLNACRMHHIEAALAGYAAGTDEFPAELSDMRYDRSVLTLRSGYYEYFTVSLDDGSEGRMALDLATVRQLAACRLPPHVRGAVDDSVAHHHAACDPGQDTLRPGSYA